MVYKLIQEEKVNRCNACAIQHPIQNQHSYLMMDNDAKKHHETQLNPLISQYEENRDSANMACFKAENALLPDYKKELRKVVLNYLRWMRAVNKDPPFRKVVETPKELDTERFHWIEWTELAINENSYSIV